MRRPSRLSLAAAALALPLTLVGCAADDGGVRTENGSGVDGKSAPSDGEDADQAETRDEEQEG